MTASWSGQDELQKIAGLIRVKSQGRGGRGGARGGGPRRAAGRSGLLPCSGWCPGSARLRLAWGQIVEGFKCQAKELIRGLN